MDVKQVERTIRNYTYLIATKEELEEQLLSIQPKITATIDAAPASGGFHSKVESIGNKRIELCGKIAKKNKELMKIHNMIEHSGLTEVEKAVMWCVAKEYRLQRYARDHKIKQSNVYKIRDRAFMKIASHET